MVKNLTRNPKTTLGGLLIGAIQGLAAYGYITVEMAQVLTSIIVAIGLLLAKDGDK